MGGYRQKTRVVDNWAYYFDRGIDMWVWKIGMFLLLIPCLVYQNNNIMHFPVSSEIGKNWPTSGLLLFFPQICDDHPQEYLTNFGYRPGVKIYKFKNPFIYRNMVNYVHFFTKFLSGFWNHIFRLTTCKKLPPKENTSQHCINI